jgi:antitoxin ParD1/3/4
MTTMNISLPETLKAFVDQQINARGFGTSSEYVRELIRKDQDRQTLRALLLSGAQSSPHGNADTSYFAALRNNITGPTAA